jgi:hypothetical protein
MRSTTGREAENGNRKPETGNVQLLGLYAHLHEAKEQPTVYGLAADDTRKAADEAE